MKEVQLFTGDIIVQIISGRFDFDDDEDDGNDDDEEEEAAEEDWHN